MMRDTRDAGSSVVIGFVILLMLVALGIGIWAMISLPAQMQEAESTHAIVLQNAFLDFKLSADKVRVNDLSGARFSMLLPGRAGISGSTVSFVNDTTSGIYVYNVTNRNQELWSLRTIGRLSASVGGTRGATEIGYEAGGVFRGDNGHMVWITPGLIEIYPDAKENRTINVEIVMPVLSGNPSISSNWGVPLNCLYRGYTDRYLSEKNLTMEIRFTTTSPSDQKRGHIQLWQTMFSEAVIRYQNAVTENSLTKLTGKEIKLVESTDNFAAMQLYCRDGISVKVYIREATYDVSLVNRYDES